MGVPWWKRSARNDALLPRTVAYVDLMGFGALASRMSEDEKLFWQMVDVVRTVQVEVEKIYGPLRDLGLTSGKIEMTAFSDCWVLSTLDHDAYSVVLHTRTLCGRGRPSSCL